MKLFGEFLVEKKLVSSEQLLTCLIKQVRSLPTVLEIVSEGKLLPTEQILKVLAHQAESGKEFRLSCEALGIWNQDLEKSVQTAMIGKKIPLGQLLLSEGHLNFQTLTSALDEFVAIAVKERKNSEPPAKAEVPSSAGGNWTPEFMDIEATALKDFLEFFSSSRKSEFESLINNIDGDKLNELVILVRAARGAARFIRASVTEKLCAGFEEQIQSGISHEDIKKNGIQYIQLLWALKESLETHLSEKPFWSDVANQEKIFAFLTPSFVVAEKKAA